MINFNLYGYNIIVKKLIEKGISRDDAKKLTNDGFERNQDEIQIIKKFIRKNFSTFKSLYEDKETGKIIFKLQTKGYSATHIEKIVNNLSAVIDEVKND